MTETLLSTDFNLLLRLLIAHFLGDFLFQKKSWIIQRQQKHWKAGYLYLHIAIIGLLTYILSGIYSNIWLPVFVMITHYCFDLWKTYTGDDLKNFVLDQILHLAIVVLAWYVYLFPNINLVGYFEFAVNNQKILTNVLAYIFVIWPAGFLIAKITQPWQDQIGKNKGLVDAGRWIGMTERILILTFVLIDQFTGIGFLIAAKSILRFSDIKNADDRKEAEYILLGTMVSFIVAICTGLMALEMMKNY
jgi:hypothetical protein